MGDPEYPTMRNSWRPSSGMNRFIRCEQPNVYGAYGGIENILWALPHLAAGAVTVCLALENALQCGI
jgi:hypothetical protein